MDKQLSALAFEPLTDTSRTCPGHLVEVVLSLSDMTGIEILFSPNRKEKYRALGFEHLISFVDRTTSFLKSRKTTLKKENMKMQSWQNK